MIPYNPSSFNSNKTILEQILELKNWLKDHPQYEVYYCNDNASLYPFMNTFSLANVPDNTNMDVGDLVVCNNAVYCTVISIDRDNGVFTAGYGVSFKGDTGAAGQQGYSLRVSSENYVDDVTAYHRNSLEPSHGTRENDTILFANGYVGIVTSLGAGATYYVTNRTVSFVGPQGPQGPQGPTGPAGADGPEGPQGVSITNVTIDGNQHLIVTLSDGSTIDAGSVSSGGPYIITISGTSSGYITNTADRNKITSNDLDVYIYNSTLDVYFRKETNVTGGVVRFSYTQDDGTGLKNGYLYITTNNWQWILTRNTNYYKTTASLVNSQTATNGQVLMANGNGGASWETPSGSGPDVVSLTGTSGTLSASDLAKVQGDNCIIKWTYGSTTEIYHKFEKVNNDMCYVTFENTSGTDVNFKLIYVGNSGNWNRYNQYPQLKAKPTASDINAGSSTNGQVLTSNGNGTASWQNAGGGSTLYTHNLVLQNLGSTYNFRLSFTIISSDSSALNLSSLLTWLNNNYHTSASTLYVTQGYISVSGTQYQCIGVYRDGTSRFGFAYWNNAVTYTDITTSYCSLVDNVVAL